MNELAKSIDYDGHEDAPSFLQGVKDCVPTLIGYISLGIATGIVGVASGVSVLEIGLFSALVYAGAAQFIIFALLVSQSPVSAIIFTTFIVNSRNFLLSMTLAPYFTKYSFWKNIGIGALVTDESFGVAITKITKNEKMSAQWMNGLNVTAYFFWILSSVAGALLGNWIANPEVLGLDFALTAMFLALVAAQLEHIQKTKLKLYLSLILYEVIAMLFFSLFMPSYLAVILSTVIVATIGVVKDR
ncbi:AzlC family ABC transporter permease [Bacillaceae bacterium SIJ1]|uniref:AzlC family ABC transporter permease n=1 Tax=Litoribacterium kuwaitense TaxID=1398745 RepID=UPI0013EC80EF|nr:AzlC family ABC transporter permease [Litoribacterium kuwaitense]NGP44770.1 AzlC family ABC transporter permease [Litoribacterium kuwaitense]